MIHVRALTALAFGCAAAAGCRADAPPEAGTTAGPVAVSVIDSAGAKIYLAESAKLAEADTVDLADPLLRIGVVQGDPDYEFQRITDVAPLGEAGFAVADGGTRTVRLFDWQGTLTATLGGPGEGPGEFRSIASVFPYRADSIAVSDGVARRISVFPLAGGAPRIIDARAESGIRAVVGTLADGRFVSRDNESGEQGLSRVHAVLMTHSAAGELLDTIGVFAGDEMFNHRSESFVARLRAPFPFMTFAGLAADRLILADGATSGFETRTLEGALAAAWRTDEAKVPLDDATAAAHLDSTLADNPMPARDGMAASWEAVVRTMPYPDSLPFTSAMAVAPEGSVWLRRDKPSATAEHWWVIDPLGQVARVVRIPGGVSLLRVTATHLFAAVTDELGVQYLHVYPIGGS